MTRLTSSKETKRLGLSSMLGKVIAAAVAVLVISSFMLNAKMLKLGVWDSSTFGNEVIKDSLGGEEQIKRVLNMDISFAAKDFSKNTYTNPLLFPPVGIFGGKGIIDCPLLSPKLRTNSTTTQAEWDTLIHNIGKSPSNRKAEFLQEIAFIEWLRSYYPRSFTIVDDSDAALYHNHGRDNGGNGTHEVHKVSPAPRVFLPFCPLRASPKQGWGQKELVDATHAMNMLQKHVPSKKIFYVSAHPGTLTRDWQELINNARALKIDQQTRGFFNDIIIPVSTMPDRCDFNSQEQQLPKYNLVYSCGSEHSKIYIGLRSGLPDAFNSLGKTGIDMSESRSMNEYELGFYKSKFCFIIPGDTTATSQASRAMCAGCVPIFLGMDFRDFPFANVLNYSSFSVRIRSNYLLTDNVTLNRERASSLYDMLQDMVLNGTYYELKKNVNIARHFFNYHIFASRSPYGAALTSIYQDEINENCVGCLQ